jgi:hypothetical protein
MMLWLIPASLSMPSWITLQSLGLQQAEWAVRNSMLGISELIQIMADRF